MPVKIFFTYTCMQNVQGRKSLALCRFSECEQQVGPQSVAYAYDIFIYLIFIHEVKRQYQ